MKDSTLDPGLPPSDLMHRLVDFCRHARQAGLPVGNRETLLVLEAAGIGLAFQRRRFHFAARSILCNSPADLPLFDQLFERFFGADPETPAHSSPRPPRLSHRSRQSIPLLTLARRLQAPDSDPGQQTTGASSQERLRLLDFSEVTIEQENALQALAERLWKEMSRRLSRRRRQIGKEGKLNLRRIIRKSLGSGGEPLRLLFSPRRLQKPRLILLLDVSGSMERYSLFLLQFVHALQEHFEKVESFVFSTRLVHVSESLRGRKFHRSLTELGKTVDAWSSGTRIGECLGEFNDRFALRLLSPGTIALILSDGLDTGDPQRLAVELRRLKSRVRKLLWLNPLMGMKDFEPLATGLQVAVPLVDRMLPAHNLESLLRLEADLNHV